MPSPEKIRNLYLAGDYCQHHLGMTTIEAAVLSGARAADELARYNGLSWGRSAASAHLAGRQVYPAWRAALGALLPTARAWAARPSATRDGAGAGAGDEQESLLSYLLTPGRPARHRRRPKPD